MIVFANDVVIRGQIVNEWTVGYTETTLGDRVDVRFTQYSGSVRAEGNAQELSIRCVSGPRN